MTSLKGNFRMAIKICGFPHHDLNLRRQIRNLLSSFLMIFWGIGRIFLMRVKPRSRFGRLARRKLILSSQS
jgi:hypothetical protein